MEISDKRLAQFSIDYMSSDDSTGASAGHLGGLIYELIKDCGGDHDAYMRTMTEMVIKDLRAQMEEEDEDDE